jgi:hypothetical protein
MNWAIAFLARTSSDTYNEVAKILMLPHISTVHQKMTELITTKNDKAYCLHMNTIQSISDPTHRENWMSHQRIRAIAQDSANINSGIEHNYVSNTLKGGDESHCIATLLQMFNAMVQEVKDTQSSDDDEKENSPTLVVQQNSILDNLLLAEEHLVFKFSSIDPEVKCLEIVASVNVAKVTSLIITVIMISLQDLLPMDGLEIGIVTSNATGCNWVLFWDTLWTHTFRDALPCEILDKYPKVDFDVKCFFSKQWIVFLPDMPHLTKNIVTSLELSSSKNLKHNLMYGKVPLHMQMMEEVWIKCDGASGQLQSSKLASWHFNKNDYSWMNVKLATQLLSQLTMEMICYAIADDGITLSLKNKGMYPCRRFL